MPGELFPDTVETDLHRMVTLLSNLSGADVVNGLAVTKYHSGMFGVEGHKRLVGLWPAARYLVSKAPKVKPR